MRIGFVVLAAVLLAGCAGTDSASWLSPSKPEMANTGPVAPSALVPADGLCEEIPADTGPRALDFGMTECEVSHLVGPLDKVEIGADEKGVRTATLTSIAGKRPGVYRFVDGRLKTIERLPEVAPPPRQTPSQTKRAKAKASGTATGLRR